MEQNSKSTKLSHYDRGTYSTKISSAFVKAESEKLCARLSSFRYGEADIGGYCPPFTHIPAIEDFSIEPGYIFIFLEKEGKRMQFYFLFNYYDEEIQDFAREELSADDTDFNDSQIIAYCFEETWQIICLVLEKLEISKITISSGGV